MYCRLVAANWQLTAELKLSIQPDSGVRHILDDQYMSTDTKTPAVRGHELSRTESDGRSGGLQNDIRK
jgi:hypothetical protein